MAASEWKFSGRQGVCAVTGRAFVEGEPVFSLLAVQDGELGRRDLSPEAWAQLDAADSPSGAVWWRTRHREGERARTLDLESIEGLFGALAEAEEEALSELRFLLSLVLLRKRRLKLVRTRREDGVESLVMRRPRRSEELLVRVHELDAERRAELREVLERLFDGEEAGELVAATSTPVGEAAASDG